MTIMEMLERNSRLYGEDVALVEINPGVPETRRLSWRDYSLVQETEKNYYRREISWNVFNEKANRFANALLERGIKKGDKVAIHCCSS